MSKVVIVGGNDGTGGLILALQCAYWVKRAGIIPKVLLSTRQECYDPLHYLFSDQFDMGIIPANYTSDHHLVFNETLIKELKGDADEFYYVSPDSVFYGKLAFDWQKYNTNLQTIKTTRLLTHKFKPSKRIYIGLVTSTPEYLYPQIPELVHQISIALPDREIFVPIMRRWADKTIEMGNFNRNFKENVHICDEPDFNEQLDLLTYCEYAVCTDNAISHLAFHLGALRCLLDPRFGFRRPCIAFQARWRQTTEESIPLDSPPEQVAQLIATNLNVPQTTLLNRFGVFNNLNSDWSRELMQKFS